MKRKQQFLLTLSFSGPWWNGTYSTKRKQVNGRLALDSKKRLVRDHFSKELNKTSRWHFQNQIVNNISSINLLFKKCQLMVFVISLLIAFCRSLLQSEVAIFGPPTLHRSMWGLFFPDTLWNTGSSLAVLKGLFQLTVGSGNLGTEQCMLAFLICWCLVLYLQATPLKKPVKQEEDWPTNSCWVDSLPHKTILGLLPLDACMRAQ